VKRRDFLKGMAGVAGAGPMLSMLPSGAQAACPDGPKRIIVMSYSMGLIRHFWQPRGTGTQFSLPYCTAPLDPFRDRCLFISNVDNKLLHLRSQYVYGHPQKKESALTGTLVTGAFGGSGRNHVDDVIVAPSDNLNSGAKSASIETVVGQAAAGSFPRQAVNLGVLGREFGRDRYDSSFYWESEANASSLIVSPQVAFDEYFAGIVSPNTGPDPRVVAERRRRGSILDAVRAQFVDLRSGLDYRDRQRLDFHAEYIRQLEVDIMSSGICRRPDGIPSDPRWHSGRSMREAAAIQTRLLAQAMACDIAPVGRIEYLVQQNPYFGIPAIDDPIAQGRMALGDSNWGWHGLCHTNANENDPVTGRPSRPRFNQNVTMTDDMYSPHLRDGMRFYVQSFADLLSELDRFVEGPDGRTVLDNSLCVLASDMGDGQAHGPWKMGYILAGNLGPFRTGYHLDCAPNAGSWRDPSDYDHTHVLTTIANAFCLRDASGAELNSFGIEGFGSGGALPVRSV
jgi:hypothetical protein